MKIYLFVIKSFRLLFIVCFFILIHYDSIFADGNKGAVFISGIQNEQTHAVAKEVLWEAYRKIGYEANFEFYPGYRSIDMANSGESDGDIARIDGTHKKFSNLVRVPTPIIHFKGVVFTKKITKKITNWKDLKGLRIGIIRGIRYSKIGTNGLSPFFAENMTHLFKLLDQDMIQIAIAVLMAGKIEISRNYKGSGIHSIGEALYTGRLYHYVNKKQQHLVPDLFSTLQNMEKQGEIQKIIDTTVNDMTKN